MDPALGDPLAQARLLAELGAAAVQLRCKGWPRDRLVTLARACKSLPITVVINDDRVAAELTDMAVHLGQDDGPDPDLPFGRSTHTLEQVGAPGRASYLGFGPVYGTLSKASAWEPRGVAMLAEAVARAAVPLIAIGGIDTTNLAEVRATGVHGWAVIGAIWRAPDPRAAIRALVG